MSWILFFRLYPVDNKISKEVAGELIDEMLKQKGWIDYYENKRNSADLSLGVIGSDGLISKDNLQKYIIDYIESHSIILADVISAQHSSDASKRNSEADVMDIDDNNNLVRSEKISFKQHTQFIELLNEGLSEVKRDKILSIKKVAFQAKGSMLDVPNGDINSFQPKITLIPEINHKIDHGTNIHRLVEAIEGGRINGNTVICLERKDHGINFGMQDVALLANILEHNKNTPQEAMVISEKIQSSPIYQDALLYNVARFHGIEVVGIEGKGLEYSKESPEYNSVREAFMAERIEQFITTGKNVIFLVGAAHIDGLKAKLSLARISSVNNYVEPLEEDLRSSVKAANNDFRSRVLASRESSPSLTR